MQLSEAIAFLDSLQGGGIRPGTERMQALLDAAGAPHHRVPAVIVAGTNGKGSTSATLASIFQQAGYRTALYTSPHLVRLEERWRVDGRDLQEQQLISAVSKLQELLQTTGVTPTYFEALTMIGFLHFAEQKCDVAVLEVGMGGRLDATNVGAPIAAAITAIGLDHREYLGDTIEEVAGEKAGVIHAGSTAVTSNRDPAVLAVITSRAAAVGASLHVSHEDVEIDQLTEGVDGVSFRYRSPDGEYLLATPLQGRHQVDNVSVAVRTAELVRPRFARVTAAAIQLGVAGTRWRGRLERFDVDGRQVVVDGAHNAHAAAVVARFIREQLPSPRTLVFGVMDDKDVEEICAELFPLFDDIVLTIPDVTRAAPEERLRRAAGSRAVGFERSPASAFDAAFSMPNQIIVICGSLYLAGDAVAFLDRKQSAAATTSSSSEMNAVH